MNSSAIVGMLSVAEAGKSPFIGADWMILHTYKPRALLELSTWTWTFCTNSVKCCTVTTDSYYVVLLHILYLHTFLYMILVKTEKKTYSLQKSNNVECERNV